MLLIVSGERLFKNHSQTLTGKKKKLLRDTFLTVSVLGIASGSRECWFPLNLLILSILSTCGSLIYNGTFCLVTAFQLFFSHYHPEVTLNY